MKKLILIFTLIFSIIIFSSPSYAEWTKMGRTMKGDTFYLDFKTIRKHDGYVYYWMLNDKLKPSKYGDLSIKYYRQVDCKLFRFKALSYSFYKEPMGTGNAQVIHSKKKNWKNPSPNSINETIQKEVCRGNK